MDLVGRHGDGEADAVGIVVLLGVMMTWMRRRFFTLDVPLTVEVVSVAVTTTSVADVSAV